MTSASNASTSEIYWYDGDGNRVAKLAGGILTAYFGGGSYEVTATSAGVVTSTKKYYNLGGASILDDGAGLKYMLSDQQGSTVAIADSNGAIVSSQRYLPFGAVRPDLAGIAQTDFGYTDQRSMSNLGLMDYKARFYDSLLGRFIQPDIVVSNPKDPQTWNRYSYVSNNPINNTDPSGHNQCAYIPGPAGEICNNSGYGAIQRENDFFYGQQRTLQLIMNSSSTSGEGLIKFFTSVAVVGKDPKTRLESILAGTSGGNGANFGVTSTDSGFKENLQDGSLWPGSAQQVGHFLTAVNLSYNSSNEVSDNFNINLIVGHEMVGDHIYEGSSIYGDSRKFVSQGLTAFTHPDAIDLFKKGGDENFGKILAMGVGQPDRYGNSMPDLRLSKLGWEFGKLTQNGTFSSIAQQVQWLQDNIVQ